jgi:hypothetical protein
VNAVTLGGIQFDFAYPSHNFRAACGCIREDREEEKCEQRVS